MPKKDIKWYIAKKLLQRTPFIARLAPRFMEKARANLVTMSILSEIPDNEKAKDALSVPNDYDPSEWVVISAYYSMYMAASSLLAKICYKSNNHSATIIALETFFIRKKLLEPEYLKMLERARLEKDLVEQLELARTRREIAQYSVTKSTNIDIAEVQKANAYKFVERVEELMEALS